MTRREFAVALSPPLASAAKPPNIVLIFVDDLGYGDISAYGHPVIRTPNVDRMAAEGIKFTSFYSTCSMCTPSRAALLTGRYPVLVRVLFPGEEFGIPESELTLGDLLRKRGYATACIGKWHLGDLPQYRPTRHGFDYYYGLLYSNDMDPRALPKHPWPCPPLSLWRTEEKVETPAVQETLTARYTAEAVRFISKNKRRPFFLYLPHSMVHRPWQASDRFRGRSRYGLYGDAVEEVDWSVGEILKSLVENGVDKKTLVIFTSDNGGSVRTSGSSNGIFHGGKGSTWEGGFREPFVARWPGKIPAGVVSAEMACTMDLLPTLLRLAGTQPPVGRPIDGVDVWAALSGGASARSEFLFYSSNWESNAQVMAIRSGPWKLHLRQEANNEFAPGALYSLEHDPGESEDRAGSEPAMVQRLAERARELAAGVPPGKQCPPVPEEIKQVL